MVDTETLLKEYPHEIGYPHGGTHYFVRWYTHNDGHHMVLARSVPALDAAFASVVSQTCDEIKVKECLRIEIVAPPPGSHEMFARDCLARDVNSFWAFVSRPFTKDGNTPPLPPGLKLCEKYEYRFDDEDVDDYCIEHHVSCKNCYEKIAPASGTLEDVYFELRHEYARIQEELNDFKSKFFSSRNKRAERAEKTVSTSRARAGDPTKPYYVAVANYGDHRNGIDLVESTQFGFKLRNVLFYYQSPEPIELSKYVGWVEDDRKRREAIAEMEARNRKKRHEEEDRFILDSINKLFP